MSRKERRKKKEGLSRPATMLDVKRAEKHGREQGVLAASAIFLRILRDNEGYGKKRLQRVWDGVTYLSESVAEGNVKIEEVITSLADEDGVYLS